jgi:succinyl-CoA synthetase alpha subunit
VSILVDQGTKIVIQGVTGREARMVTRCTLAYGTPIAAGVTPGRGGQSVEGVPVYDTLATACGEHDINTSIVYVPPASVYDAVGEAIHCGIRLICIPTENVPQQDAIKLLALARSAEARVVGPNSLGIISPGHRVKLGAIGGDNPARCFSPGPVGIISRSGGMTAEMAWTVKQAGFGVSAAVSVGGDALIGSSPCEILQLFQADDETRLVVYFGEPGTTFEEELAEFLRTERSCKPLLCLVAGRFTEEMPEGTVFGHAASLISGDTGRPSAKLRLLREAGAIVADSLEDVVSYTQETLGG